MGRAQARSLFPSLFTGRQEQLWISQGPQGWQDARQSTDASPRQPSAPQRSASAPPLASAHNAQHTCRAHALRQAQSSCWPTGRRVRPGVTATTSLTLAAASHWPAGPSLGLMHRQCRCHYRARPRERQAHIRECLGQF